MEGFPILDLVCTVDSPIQLPDEKCQIRMMSHRMSYNLVQAFVNLDSSAQLN